MRRSLFIGVLGSALLLAAARPGVAQDKQWRFTPFAGGSVLFGTVDFDNTWTVGGSAAYRAGRYGFELTGQYSPSEVTSLVAFTTSDLEVPDGPQQEVLLSYAGSQDFLFSSANILIFGGSWQPNQPPPPREWYAALGVGLVRFMDDHPARSLAGNEDEEWQGWAAGDMEFTFDLGVGVQFNLSSNLSLQLEIRDYVFRAVERFDSLLNHLDGNDTLEKSFHNNVVIRQGVTFVRF